MHLTGNRRTLTAIAAATLLSVLSGCATVRSPDPRDPFESFNRGVFEFNQTADKYVIKPAARVYKEVLPSPLNTGISNFFSNLSDVIVVANDLLQLKVNQALSDSTRIVFNSTIGIGGLVDVGSHIGLPKHHEDFGQTLGYYGVGPGPYLVLPFLGPSTVRDAIGNGADLYLFYPVAYLDSDTLRAGLYSLQYLDYRADELGSEKVLEAAALDKYSFLRDAYLQRRRSMVHDGNPPPSSDDSDQ